MDKQREEFENRHESFVQEDKGWIMYGYDAGVKAAQTAMQPEIDRLTSNQCSGHFRIGCSYMSGCNTICNKCGHVHNADTGLAYIQQLNAANKRIEELEATMNQVRSTYNQIIAEDTATRNEYLDEIAKLEERIRVADAEEPVGESTSGGEARIYSGIPLPRLGSKLYLHAQIPAEVAPSSYIVPDRYCKQSKCANATTGCVGYCKLDELSKGLSVTMVMKSELDTMTAERDQLHAEKGELNNHIAHAYIILSGCEEVDNHNSSASEALRVLSLSKPQNWLAEQKAQWRREVLEEAAEGWDTQVDHSASTIRTALRRMADQPKKN